MRKISGKVPIRWLIKKVLVLTSIILLASLIIIEGLILSSSRTDKHLEVDYVVILGAGLRGEDLSVTLLNRLTSSLDYLKKYPKVKIVVSGGQGPDEVISEAEAMQRFLEKRGINPERIIKEDQSTSTNENLKLTREIIAKEKSQDKIKIMIVTSSYHMFRAKLLAQRHGFIPYGITSEIPNYLKPYYFSREYLAVIKSLFF